MPRIQAFGNVPLVFFRIFRNNTRTVKRKEIDGYISECEYAWRIFLSKILLAQFSAGYQAYICSLLVMSTSYSELSYSLNVNLFDSIA